MRFTVPFLLAIAVYVATVLGANQTSFNPNEDMLYDVVSASDAIAFRLERAIGIAEKPALLIGALLLTLPALLTFHLFRIGFGGSVQTLIQEDRLSRQISKEREHAQTARYAAASGATYEGEALSRSRAGDNARTVDDGRAAAARERRSERERRDENDERKGFGANIAAAIKGRKNSRAAKSERQSSGTTSLGGAVSETTGKKSGRGLKDRWAGMLDNKPDFSRLKNGTQGLRERMGATSAKGGTSTKLSIDDLAEEIVEKSTDR